MRKDPCLNCEGTGNKFFCKQHKTESIWCGCSCIECDGYGKLRIKISDEELDKLTLKVSQVLVDTGISVAKYNESNNILRHILKKFLVEWCDYNIDKYSDWRNVDWIELRSKFQLPDPFKNNYESKENALQTHNEDEDDILQWNGKDF